MNLIGMKQIRNHRFERTSKSHYCVNLGSRRYKCSIWASGNFVINSDIFVLFCSTRCGRIPKFYDLIISKKQPAIKWIDCHLICTREFIVVLNWIIWHLVVMPCGVFYCILLYLSFNLLHNILHTKEKNIVYRIVGDRAHPMTERVLSSWCSTDCPELTRGWNHLLSSAALVRVRFICFLIGS